MAKDVREYAARLHEAEEGMAARSAEFRQKGSEMYLPVKDGIRIKGSRSITWPTDSNRTIHPNGRSEWRTRD